jgi:hypothetical protein
MQNDYTDAARFALDGNNPRMAMRLLAQAPITPHGAVVKAEALTKLGQVWMGVVRLCCTWAHLESVGVF